MRRRRIALNEWSAFAALGMAASFVMPSSPASRAVVAAVKARAPVELWRLAGEGHGRPAISEGRVYFLSAHHQVLGVDAVSGRLLWTESTGEAGATTEGSAVTIAGDRVIAGDYNLTALDRATGEPRWRFVPAIGYAPGIYLGDATDRLVLAGSPAGRLYAVDAASGVLRWHTVVADDGRSTVYGPVTDGEVVAAAFTSFSSPALGGIALFDLVDGRERWRSRLPMAADRLVSSGFAGGPVLTDSEVIVAAGDGRIHGFDRRDGSLRWTLPGLADVPAVIRGPVPITPAASGADYRPLLLNGNVLIAGSLKGIVVAYDLITRRERWRWSDGRSGSVAFALSGDDRELFVPFASGKHVALGTATGAERWRIDETAGQWHWPAAFDAERVFLAGSAGGYVAYRREPG